MNYLQTNYSSTCRTCLMESSSTKSLFSCEQIMDQKVPLCDMLMSCASIFVVQGDGLPENICFSCFQQMNTAYLFRKLCEKSDGTLREYNNTATLSSNHCNIFSVQLGIDNSKFGLTLDSKLLSQQNETEFRETNKEIGSCLDTPSNYLSNVVNISDTNKDNSSFHSNTQENYSFKCDACGMKFNTENLLTHHRSEHKNHTTKKTSNKSDAVKKRNQSRTCDICNKTFRFHSNLERHKLIHTGEKPFLCNVCGKGFGQMAYLKIHSFTHTGEKPYKCQMCEKSFAAPGTLMTHVRRHTGERPHTCKICGKDFSQSGYLSAHIRTHTGEKPIECKVCNRRFSQSSRLITHMRIHSGEKPYQCKMCNRSFAVKSTLKKHIRTHTGERPYKCIVCDQAFAQNGTLATHMRVHKPKTNKDKLISWV